MSGVAKRQVDAAGVTAGGASKFRRGSRPDASRNPTSDSRKIPMNRTFRQFVAHGVRRRVAGFTLIELMVTVAIVGILVAVALPNYRNYVIRGKLVEGTNALAAQRTQMEQYYQDNRTYSDVSSTIVSPCSSTVTAGTFTLTCTSTATTYTLTATGSKTTAGAVYTVDEKNAMVTSAFPTSWGAVPSNNKCWIMRRGDSC
jgi:type IV pilus assembly protein PilE